MCLSNILKVLRLTCGITLMIFGLLLMLLMIVLPGLVMVVLGTGLIVNQLLRCIRLLAVLSALLIFYQFIIRQSHSLAHSLLWFGLALTLMLYALFALKLQHILSKSAHQFFKSRFY